MARASVQAGAGVGPVPARQHSGREGGRNAWPDVPLRTIPRVAHLGPLVVPF